MRLMTAPGRTLFAFRIATFLILAGCSEFGKPEPGPDPNIFPANYKADLTAYLRRNPDFLVGITAASISAPVLTQFGLQSRYVVCLRLDGPNGRKEKIAIFFAAMINQLVDATAEQCRAAAYQPFPELLTPVTPR
jgi:hypothetical protein